MADIPAIETRYKGHRFRSRLEARWAVFFSELGIHYEYELEGYKLPSGRSYLPDFYLPEFDVFVEVKPHKRMSLNELSKVVEFPLEAHKNLILIIGTPTNQLMLLFNRFTTDLVENYGDGNLSDAETVEDFLSDSGDSEVVFSDGPFDNKTRIIFREPSPFFQCKLSQSLLKAKQARFEFGEEG